ncbi:MAG TPA: flagellar hook-basal body complex protein FliE [Stellaceae bacterium]|nr:flagellar hook-basal body complex protein FliE [Stellaceae bacterium]
MIEAISAMGAVLSELQSLAGAATAPSTDQLVPDVGAVDGAAPSFMQTLQGALDRVDSSIATADASAKAFSAGDQNIPLSDVMVSLEQANLALQMASGVRDKVVAAYTSVMNMQV